MEKANFILRVETFFGRYLESDVALFIACQFALESAYGTSNLAKEAHNFCGMKKPVRRTFLGSHHTDYKGFAVYYDLDNCMYDYLYWLFSRCKANDLEDVAHYSKFLLRAGYCPDHDYVDRIYSIYKQFKS